MDAPSPEQDIGSERYGLVLNGRTYQALFSYTVDERWEPGPATIVPHDAREKVFFRVLPIGSLVPILILASSVALLSISVWQGWIPNLAVSQNLIFVQSEFWRIFSALFQHADAKHLLNNLLPFVGLGWLLWGYFGSLAFPIVPIFVGALANFLAILTYHPQVQLVGISGTVFAMAGMWSALYIKNDNRFSVGKRILRAMGFVLILFFPLSLEANIADRVHILGGVLGFCAGYLGWGKLLPERVNAQKNSVGRVRVL
ncbi:MAG: hypothetical protein RI932_515 [Pseudomonadota bacterium]